MKISSSFKFETPKEQIENEIMKLRGFWEESNNEDLEWNKEYKKYGEKKEITKPYGLLVSVEIFNQIREIYLCDSPFPHDTPDLYGLRVEINTKKNPMGEIVIMDKKEIDKLAGDD